MFRDLRFSCRLLRKSPTFFLTAVLSLALGIGATTTVFSAFRAVFLRPLPYSDPERLAAIGKLGPEHNSVSINQGDVDFWRKFSHSFESLGTYTSVRALSMTGSGEAANVFARGAGHDLFSTLAIRPATGRVFAGADFEDRSPRTILLTWKLWHEKFQGDPGVAGRMIKLDGATYTVIGAMPYDFRIASADAWIPDRDPVQNPFETGRNVIARLKPAVTMRQAAAELEGMRVALAGRYPRGRRDFRLTVEQLGQGEVANLRGAFQMLLGAVGLLALIACLNVANLMIARSVAREGEFAVRNALGASRSRLMQQVFAESLLLALIGGAAGLTLALLGHEALSKWLPTYQIARLAEMRIDPQVLGFATAITLLTPLLFGIGPALALSRLSLRELGRTSTANGTRVRWRGALIAAEVALSMTLLTGSGLLIRSFVTLAGVNPGFRADHVLTAMIPAGTQLAADKPRLEQRFTSIAAGISRLPGVTDTGVATAIPMGSVNISLRFSRDESTGQEFAANFRAVSPGYLRAMGTPLLQGRFLTDMDTPDAPRALVVNQAFVRKYWPGQNPVGKQLPNQGKAPMVVVGLIADTHSASLSSQPEPEVLGHYRQYLGPSLGAMLIVRTNGDPAGLATAIRQAVHALFPDQPVTDIATMQTRVSDSIREPRLYMWMLVLFASLALLLTAIGIYGVVSYAVGQQVREFGIRMALGARSQDVLSLVMRRGVLLALSGVAVGVAGAWTLSRYLESLLFGVSPRDPWAFAAAAVVLILVATVACYGPARRATSIDPNLALRED